LVVSPSRPGYGLPIAYQVGESTRVFRGTLCWGM
jgi:hypothetical protein